MKRGSMVVLGALVALANLAWLSTESPAANRMTSDGNGSSTASNSLPFGGYLDGSITIHPPFSPGSSPECNANFTGIPGAPGHSVTVIDVGSGFFNQIGGLSFESFTCVDPTSASNPGTGVLTGANGEKIFIAFDNDVQRDPDDPSRVTATGPQWVTGGTGRFEGATGTQECHFWGMYTSPTTAVIHGTCIGTIELRKHAPGGAQMVSAGPRAEPGGSTPSGGRGMSWGRLKVIYR